MTSTGDDRWYAFVRLDGQQHVRENCEGYVFDDYEQALAWRERTEAERSDVTASGMIPEAVREHTRRLAAEHRNAEDAAGAAQP